MQTPKAKPSNLEAPQRKSPATPRTARQLKTGGTESDSVSSPNPVNRMPKDRSPKVSKSPRSPAVEKKRPGRVSELEAQLAQLQEDLKKAKDQLSSSELAKKHAQQEAEECQKQLSALSEKLQESQKQLIEFTASEDARVQELRKISHDRDKAWQSELEAVQKQHSMDSAALASAMSEIQKLKNQLEVVTESEASNTKHTEAAYLELQSLRTELTETLTLVEKLRAEISGCRESEAQAIELVSETKKQLEVANMTSESLRSDGIKAMEAYNSILSELEQSKAHAKTLELLVSELQGEVSKTQAEKSLNVNGDVEVPCEGDENEESNKLRTELNSLKLEVGQLKAALEASETRYQEEYIQSTLQIRSAYEQIEQTKSELGQREAKLEAELKKAKEHIEELKANLMDKETELQNILAENEDLNLKMEKSSPNDKESQLGVELEKYQNDLAELKACLSEKENQLQRLTGQNQMLTMEIKEGELEKTKFNDEAVATAEAARAAEQEALVKLGHAAEEADKSSSRAARVTEQLDAAQAANTEMEAELRRMKVQCDQWRKAAEAAAAMLSTGNNGKYVDRTGSLDNSYNTIGRTLDSPYSEDMDDESPKKKNANMLKKIGILWKKGQKTSV